jgi:Tfp pilus assembly protein PilF
MKIIKKLKRLNHKRLLVYIFAIMSITTAFACTAGKSNLSKEETIKKSDALRNLGEAHLLSGNYTLALGNLLDAEKIDPQNPYIHDDLGLVYIAKGRPDLAIEHFKKALVIKPEFTPAMNNLGTAYLARKEWDAAISILKKINSDLLYATPYMPLSNIGWAYYNKKRYNLAKKYYLDALKMEPKFITALHGLGLTYTALGEYAQAIKILEKGVKLAPVHADIYLALGNAYRLSRDYKKALKNYEKVIKLTDENSQVAIEAVKKVNELK